MKHRIVLFVVFALWGAWSFGQTANCENFNATTGNWQTSAATISINNAPPTSDGTNYMQGNDGASTVGSWIFNETDYVGNLGQNGGGCLCWDYNVFDDGVANNSPNMTPRIIMYQGTATAQTLSATFLATNVVITENNGWVRICAPIRPSNNLPASNDGAWTMNNPNQWNNLISNVSGFAFITDVAGSPSQNEVIGIDNFCFTNNYVVFHFEDENGNEQEVFCIGDDVYMDGSLTANTGSYFIDIWRVNNDGSLTWLEDQNVNGWATGSPDLINLTELFENDPENPLIFEAGTTYSVKLAINSPCGWIEWSETFTMIEPDSVDYHYENEDGVDQTEFCLGEDVYVNGSATLNTGSYFMDLWIVDSNGDYDWISGAGWITGSPDFVNITELFENDPENPVTFEVGETYGVKLAINDPQCGWVSIIHDFKIIDCCDEFTDASFLLDVDASSGGYSLIAKDFETYDFLGDVTHEWYILSSPNPSGGPYTPVHSTTTTGPGPVLLYNDAQYGLYYTVIHRVITECGELCFARVQFQEGLRSSSTSIPTGEADCCLIEEFWPNGVGEPMEFTAEFQMGLDFAGNIIAQPVYPYGNNPSVVHEWYLFSSPNPSGGPYTFVDMGTGENYSYGPIDENLYYFLIHKVKSDCNEACFGRSICINCVKTECELCGPIDCSLLEDIKPDCKELPAPTNLQVVGSTLTWDPVPGATSYFVSSPGINDPQISCPECRELAQLQPVSVLTNSYNVPVNMQDDCFIWQVTAVCYDGTVSGTSTQQCFYPIRGVSNFGERVVISPNPSDGNITFGIDTTYDSPVFFEIFDLYGKSLYTFEDSVRADSRAHIPWNGNTKLGLGVYIVKISTDRETVYKRIIVER